MINWNPYLQSIRNEYQEWWQVYTITDVVGTKNLEKSPRDCLFDFGLMVETVEETKPQENPQQKEEKKERLGVLEGLRKYKDNHVLLSGKPGSGKSTSLIRLLLEEATKLRFPPSPPFQAQGCFKLK